MEGAPARPLREPAEGAMPELSSLGKRIELLRIERGVSKQWLARYAGTSRQQLWRVMTGKSDLTSSLCERLADVLGVDAAALHEGARPPARRVRRSRVLRPDTGPATPPSPPAPAAPSLAHYLADPALLLRTVGSLPGGAPGRRLAVCLVDTVATLAEERGDHVPEHVRALRERLTSATPATPATPAPTP